MRLYVFSSGWLTLDKSGLQTGATGKITVPVAFFLIKHPKGNVLFDTGNNDKIITDPTYWGPLATALDPGRSPDVAIDAQLDKIGVKPADINYVAELLADDREDEVVEGVGQEQAAREPALAEPRPRDPAEREGEEALDAVEAQVVGRVWKGSIRALTRSIW